MKLVKNKVTGAIDRILDTIAEADTSNLKLPFVGIFYNTRDYPGKYAARVFDGENGTNVVVVMDDLQKLKWDMETNGMTYLPRGSEDVKELVCVYI